MAPRITFITGTDTGVGKTVLTALLLHHLRSNGVRALAVKPFCSGDPSDISLLGAVQDWELEENEITPPYSYFDEPIAPLVAGRLRKRTVKLQRILAHIRSVAARCDHLLVEGAGGLLVPLGTGYNVRDLILSLQCAVVVVSSNKLGTINHTLMTCESLLRGPVASKANKRPIAATSVRVAFMECETTDASSSSNFKVIKQLLPAGVSSVEVPYLGSTASRVDVVRSSVVALRRVLKRLVG